MVTGWRAYTRPRLALATLLANLLESTWLARRCWRRQAYRVTFPALVDTGCGLVSLVAIAAATTPEDRTTWLNWMCPLTFGTAAGVAMAIEDRERDRVARGPCEHVRGDRMAEHENRR